jgi:L-Ala-D/L-Glu epimerase / N-acetyl-D-glutamate racemase
VIIDAVTTRAMEIPLRRDFVTSVRRDGSMKGVIIEIRSADGLVGYGEAPQNTRLTGETMPSIEAFTDMFSAVMRGACAAQFRDILADLAGFPFNTSAKSGIVGALTDLLAKSMGVPLHGLLGGRPRALVNNVTISLGPPEAMLADVLHALDSGYTVLKIKLDGDEETNLQRMRLLSSHLPEKARCRLDPNQSWSRKSAVRQITAFRALADVEFVEQPVHRADIAGLRFVRDNVDVPIVADESVYSESDALHVLEMQAADILNIKLVKCGGAVNAMRIADLAEQFAVECMVGCTTETQLSLASSAAVAMAHKNVAFVDLDGACHLSGIPFADPFESYGPRIEVGDGPGCGVREVDFGSGYFGPRHLTHAAH